MGAQNVFTFPCNLQCVSKSALLLPPFFVLHSHQFPGKMIDSRVENFPPYPRNATSFWSKSAFPLMAKNLLAKCTVLMVSNLPMTHPKIIIPIMMMAAPCSTDTSSFNSCRPSRSSFVLALLIANNLATTDTFCAAVGVGITAALAGCCTSCVGGVRDSCTPCVFVFGTPILFARALISATTPTLPCIVAYTPAADMVKPGLTGASPQNTGPMIRVVAALMTRPSNNVPLTLAPSSFVFVGWASFIYDSGGLIHCGHHRRPLHCPEWQFRIRRLTFFFVFFVQIPVVVVFVGVNNTPSLITVTLSVKWWYYENGVMVK